MDDVRIEPMTADERSFWSCSAWMSTCRSPAVAWIRTRYNSSTVCDNERCAAQIIESSTP